MRNFTIAFLRLLRKGIALTKRPNQPAPVRTQNHGPGGESESAVELRSRSPCIVQDGIATNRRLVGIATERGFALILLGYSSIGNYRNSASIVPIGKKNLRSILGISRNPYFL